MSVPVLFFVFSYARSSLRHHLQFRRYRFLDAFFRGKGCSRPCSQPPVVRSYTCGLTHARTHAPITRNDAERALVSRMPLPELRIAFVLFLRYIRHPTTVEDRLLRADVYGSRSHMVRQHITFPSIAPICSKQQPKKI